MMKYPDAVYTEGQSKSASIKATLAKKLVQATENVWVSRTALLLLYSILSE